MGRVLLFVLRLPSRVNYYINEHGLNGMRSFKNMAGPELAPPYFSLWLKFSFSASHQLDEIKSVQIHDLVPCCHEVFDKLCLRVFLSVDFRQGPKLGV